MHEIKFYYVEFSTFSVISMLRMFQTLEHFRFYVV